MRQPAGYTVQKNAALSISRRFFRCFPMCVAFRIGFYGVFADSRLFAHASLELHLYLSSVHVLVRYIGGEGGGGSGRGGDDVHANAASVLCFSCCFVFCALVGRGGMGAFRFCGSFIFFRAALCRPSTCRICQLGLPCVCVRPPCRGREGGGAMRGG